MIEEADVMSKRELDKFNYLGKYFDNREVPEGLSPIFYHTLTYEGDIEQQREFNVLKEKYDRISGPINLN